MARTARPAPVLLAARDRPPRLRRLVCPLPRSRLPVPAPTRHHRRLIVSKLPARRTLFTAAAVLVVGAALVALASAKGSDVTKARLERDLPVTFSNLYVQQAKLLGHDGITVRSLHAKASCDKGGPKVADRGPGSDWICLMSWSDPNVPLPDGTAKFEVNAHSNNCYTAGGPSKFIGQLTITDTHGHDVPNPVFEFDSCFDPKTSNAPTGVDFTKPASASVTPAQQAAAPAALTLPRGTMAADRAGAIAPALNCSAGQAGCAGTLTPSGGGKSVTTKYVLPADDTEPVKLALPPGTTGVVTLKATPIIGTAPKPRSSFTLAGR